MLLFRQRRRSHDIHGTLRDIRQRAEVLARLSDRELRDDADRLRDLLSRVDAQPNEHLHETIGLAVEAVRRTLGKVLYDVQIHAATVLASGRVAEMHTGEGKTLTASPVAIARGLSGRGVHVVTPNCYLAERDCAILRPAYEILGLSVGLLPERSESDDKYMAYQADITYGTGYEFGFDYLRDQTRLRNQQRGGLGESIVDRLRNPFPRGSETKVLQRSREFSLIDEVDHVLMDDASSPLILSESTDTAAIDTDAVLLARRVALALQPDYHYHISGTHGSIELTPVGRERIVARDIAIPVRQLQRSWMEYIENALHASIMLRRDVHYVVEDNEIRIVETSTGRIFSDRTWRDGLHQAVEAKENLAITGAKKILAQITRQRFYRLYNRLAGMTGTAAGCEREFWEVYALEVEKIPLRVPSRREVWPMRSFASQEHKWNAIIDSVDSLHRTGRPVLVGTRSIADSERAATLLSQRGLPFCLLNGRQDAEEAEVVSDAGREGAITVATNLAGRGTDIHLGEGVDELGGLHVIVAEPHESSRVDRQLVGRSARQGNRGSAQTFVSADDAIVEAFGAWLKRPLQRMADKTGEARLDLSPRIARLQQHAERMHYAGRATLLQQDIARDSLVAQLGQAW